MTTTDQLSLARRLAETYHAGQTRRDELTPYTRHLERVAARLYKWPAILDVRHAKQMAAIGWLHDILENTTMPAEGLLAAGVDPQIVEVVKILTRDKTKSYADYIYTILHHESARMVKIADILDNLGDEPSEKQIVKYAQALLYLYGET